MSQPSLSVVIPTRDRIDRLTETVRATLEQARHIDLEIIVVDDGSSESPEPALHELLAADSLEAHGGKKPAPGKTSAQDSGSPLSRPRERGAGGVRASALSPSASIRVVHQDPSGPAAARNRGAELAQSDRVLFLGDDTRPAPGTLQAHLDVARRYGSDGQGVGIQGHIDWDPEHEITELMHFLAPAGPQFYFKGLQAEQPIPFTAVLGSNLSVPTEWLRKEPFNEGFPHAAVEDTEAAWRWHRRGWTTLYAPQALCWHHHRYDALEPFLERQRRAGASARHASRLHPRLLPRLVVQPTLMGLVVRARKLLGRAPQHSRPEWDLACRRAFLAGFLSGN